MTTSKNKFRLSHVIYLILFIILLSVIRWSWHEHVSITDPPAVERGTLDLRGIALEHTSSFPMEGKWEFYPGQWIGNSNINEASRGQKIQVPGNWKTAIHSVDHEAYGYGTYHVRILLDHPMSEPLSLWFQSIYTASEIEINGKVLTKYGVFADLGQGEGQASETRSFLVTYMQSDQTELNLFVRVTNDESPQKGGIVRSVQFGTQKDVNQKFMISAGLQLIVCVILLLHALYALIIYLMNVRKTEFIMFSLMMVAAAMTIAVYHNGLLFLWIDANFSWMLRLKALAYIWFGFFLLMMGRGLIGAKRRGWPLYSYVLLLVSYTLFIFAGPQEILLYSLEQEHFMVLYYVPLFWTAYYFFTMVISRAEGALFLLFAVFSVINNILWGTVYYAGTSQFMFYPVDLLAAITSFSAYWFRRYFHNSNEVVLLNTQLAEASRQKDRFLANTSHELRTPLHGIMNIAQSVLTRKKHLLDEQSQSDMELLIMVSRRMSHMLNDLLDVVRLQDKRIALHMTAVQVQTLAAGVMDMLRFLTDGTQVELRMNIKDDLPFVYADEERLVQILINLVHNAIKYTEAGSVELTAEQVNGQVWIQVKDTGAGMDEALQKRIFMPYEQGTTGGGGIGLGLSICKDLVGLHGSELKVQSQPGKGSVFSFNLSPVDEKLQFSPPVHTELDVDSLAYVRVQLAAEAPAAVTSGYSMKGIAQVPIPSGADPLIRVLAVDDDPVNLKVLVHILSTEPYHIETALSAQEALGKLNQGSWDLVIADVMMPGISGYELTRLIRQRFMPYELPIILLTARGEPEDIYAGFLAGANDYVTKPVDALELKYRAWSLSSLKQAVNDRLRMEAAYLQAQIHPHFLFNSLNSIMALSEIDTEKMKNLAEAFTAYLRISFDFLTAGKLVPLSRELQLVENYLYIEQQRFEERLQVEWEVNVDLGTMIPPLTVQPLVENAVRHGILRRAKGGTLRIVIESQGDAIHFRIADTGIGMDEEQISKLLIPAENENRGIGLYNTHSRLTRLYGNGLQIQSKQGEGTTVSFSIPKSTRSS